MVGLGTRTTGADAGVVMFRGVPLPEDRHHAVGVGSLETAQLLQAGPDQEVKYHELALEPDYRSWRDLLASYVAHCIPHAAELQRCWILTALPSTGGGRLFTVSVRGTETFYAPTAEQVVLNVAAGPGLFEHLVATGVPEDDLSPMDFAINERCPGLRVSLGGVASMAALLEDGAVVDAAYALNRALLLHGTTALRAHHNGAFAADVLLRAWRRTTGAVDVADPTGNGSVGSGEEEDGGAGSP